MTFVINFGDEYQKIDEKFSIIRLKLVIPALENLTQAAIVLFAVETACGGNVFDLKSPNRGNGNPDRIEHQLVFKIPI